MLQQKQKKYGLKTEIAVIQTGLCIPHDKHKNESVSDISIFWEGIVWHRSALRRAKDDKFDTGAMGNFPKYWAVLL